MDFLALDFLTECIRISLNLKILVKKLFVYGLLEFFFLERNVFRGGGGGGGGGFRGPTIA